MDKNSKNIIYSWYYENFGVWDKNLPNWDEKTLILRAKTKEITIKECSQKLNWNLVNKKEFEKYKKIFLELSSIPTKDEVAYAIHGKNKSNIDDIWDNELQNKNNPAGLVNIENEINKHNKLKMFKYLISGLCFMGTFLTIGYSFF